MKEKEATKAKELADEKIIESLFVNIEDVSCKKERIAKFKESLTIIENLSPTRQQYYNITLCYTYAKVLYNKFKETRAIDYKELAYYLDAVMNDIEYVAANDTSYYSGYQAVYRIDKQDFISCIVEAIVVHLSEADMKRFMMSVATIGYNKDKLGNIVNYFRCVIHKYVKIKKYQEVVEYGKWFMTVYEEKAWNCTTLGVDDFKNTVDAIHADIDQAYKVLKISDKEHEDIMADIRKREAETPAQRRNRERAELYDQAERCRAEGDMDGYRGNSSALGDIGR